MIEQKSIKLTAICNVQITFQRIALGVEANTPQAHAAKRNVPRSIAEDPQKALILDHLKETNPQHTIAGNV